MRFAVFILVFQSLLLLVHAFVYETWMAFAHPLDPRAILGLRVATALLSVSFVAASLLAWRTFHWTARLFYTLAAVWLGTVSFCFLAACGCWLLLAIAAIFHLHLSREIVADVLFGLAILASIFAIVNAACTRVTRVTVKLPNLPEAWRGRVAALVSDTHLGHIRNFGFLRRLVRLLNNLRPDVVFIAGDMYDGTIAPLEQLAGPWRQLSVPFGAYFITGNHEEFSPRTSYIEAVSRAGVRVLNNEKIEIEGLQIVGVLYRESSNAQTLQAVLQREAIDPARASILLAHAPHLLEVSESQGISLQLSGHTHGGQFMPFTWITSRIYGQYVHGLHAFGKMLVFTNWGAGTWGPPMRLGTNPEIVLLKFK